MSPIRWPDGNLQICRTGRWGNADFLSALAQVSTPVGGGGEIPADFHGILEERGEEDEHQDFSHGPIGQK